MKKAYQAIIILIVAMVFFPVMNDTFVAYAGTNGHSQADAVQWAKDRANEHYEINDGSGWTQCTEFVWAYYEYLVGYHVRGNACDYLTNTYGACPAGWTRPDKSTARPGDIVVWDKNTKFRADGSDYCLGYGHIGVIVSVNGNSMVTVEANAGEARGAAGYKYNREVSCISGLIRPDFPTSVSVNFSDWNSAGRTYIGATDASIGQNVNVSGGSWTGVGMILYDNNKKELGRAGDTPTQSISQYYYKINDELHVTLSPNTTYQYRFYADVSGKRYYSSYKSFTSYPLDVIFNDWESSGKTYIAETDASIGQSVNVSGGSWTGVGMILYDSDKNELGRGGDTPTAGIPQYYYKINEELGVTLKHATTYFYRFYAVVNGKTYYSDYKSFTTSGSHSWDSGTMIQEPTSVSEGIIIYTCTKCGTTRTEKIDMTGESDQPEPDFTVNWSEPYSFPSKYSALVSTIASVDSQRAFSEASIKVWDSSNNLVASKVENDSTNNTTSLPIWYDIYSETGSLLEPAKDYTYQITVIADGKEFKSPIWSFTTEGSRERHYGIDVSSHQNEIDWNTAAKYIDFAIIRCGIGSDYTNNDDEQWLNNVKGCEENNIPYGVYIYSYAENASEAASEADHVIRLLKGHSPALPVYLDLEDSKTVGNLSNAQILDQVKIFSRVIKAEGLNVGVYASKSWWESKLTDDEYNNYEKWVAAYTGTYAEKSSGVDMWQYSSSGSVPGISGRVDINYRTENVVIDGEEPIVDPVDQQDGNQKPDNQTSDDQQSSDQQPTSDSEQPTVDPAEEYGEDGTAVGPGASEEAADEAIKNLPDDSDPAGAKFAPLKLKSSKQGKTYITLKWTKVNGAEKYVIYGNKCGKNNKPKRLAKVTGNTKTVKKAASRKLKKGTYYKFMVVALDSNNRVISTSKIVHIATKGGKVRNYTKLTTKAKKNKVTLKKGKTFKLGAKATGKNVKKHVGVRYESSNKKVATVTKSGKIKGKKKGTCKIYVFAQNGLYKTIKVTVK